MQDIVQSVEAEVQRIAGSWRGGPRIAVVPTARALPPAAPSDARGFYQRGAVWVVANAHHAYPAGRTVVHEGIAHHGTRELFGSPRPWFDFMLNIGRAVRAGDPVLRAARMQVQMSYLSAGGGYDLRPAAEADEIAAVIAECHFDPAAGRIAVAQPLRKMAKAAGGWWARRWLHADIPVDHDQLQGTLLLAQHRVRHGGMVFGLGKRLRDWYAGVMASKWNPYAPPRTMAENERLLKASRDLQATKDGWWLFANVAGFLFLLVVIAAGVFDTLAGAANWLVR